MNSQLISTFDFEYNPGGVDLKSKLPSLAKGPFSMTLQVGSLFYLAEVYFNYACNWIFVKIKNQSGAAVQAQVYIREWPVNLILTQELRDYGLFYRPDLSRFEFYKLSKNWYNMINTDFFEYTKTLYNRVML